MATRLNSDFSTRSDWDPDKLGLVYEWELDRELGSRMVPFLTLSDVQEKVIGEKWRQLRSHADAQTTWRHSSDHLLEQVVLMTPAQKRRGLRCVKEFPVLRSFPVCELSDRSQSAAGPHDKPLAKLRDLAVYRVTRADLAFLDGVRLLHQFLNKMPARRGCKITFEENTYPHTFKRGPS